MYGASLKNGTRYPVSADWFGPHPKTVQKGVQSGRKSAEIGKPTKQNLRPGPPGALRLCLSRLPIYRPRHRTPGLLLGPTLCPGTIPGLRRLTHACNSHAEYTLRFPLWFVLTLSVVEWRSVEPPYSWAGLQLVLTTLEEKVALFVHNCLLLL